MKIMGKKAQTKREKKEIAEKERKESLRIVEGGRNPWSRFWKRLDFWVYVLCFIALVALPFVKPDTFGEGRAVIHTSMGDIEVAFYNDAAPNTIENFKELARSGYYDHLTWHRVIKGFMIQSGDPNGDGTGGADAKGGTFADEINADSLGLDKEIVGTTPAVYNQLSTDDKKKYANMTVKQYYASKGFNYINSVTSHKMEAGSLAMANYGPDTNGSQFFIVSEAAQPHLDGQHTVFGHVTKGLDIVKKISEVATNSSTDKPLDPVYINSIQIFDNSGN